MAANAYFQHIGGAAHVLQVTRGTCDEVHRVFSVAVHELTDAVFPRRMYG